MAPTRWGIAGAGRISFDFVNSISLLTPGDHEVVAVGARSLSGAEEFAKQFKIPTAYGSYQELAEDKSLDVVYIGTIHPTHYELCLLFINAGKNVLCEKPMTMNADQAKVVLELAKEKNVFFMEGFWSRCFPVYDKLRETFASDVIGDVKFVKVSFGFDIMEVKRINDKSLGGGATLDLGCYPVQFAQMVFQEYPQKIVSSGMLAENGIDIGTFTTLHYSGGRIAQVCCHAGANIINRAEVIGTKGTIEVPNFWCPESVTINGETIEFPLPKSSIPMKHFHSEGFMYEAESVRQCLLKGLKENPKMRLQESQWNMSILSEILNQCGVKYDV